MQQKWNKFVWDPQLATLTFEIKLSPKQYNLNMSQPWTDYFRVEIHHSELNCKLSVNKTVNSCLSTVFPNINTTKGFNTMLKHPYNKSTLHED